VSQPQAAPVSGKLGIATAAAPTPTSQWLLAWLRDRWPLLVVLLGFALAAAIVPTLTQVSTTDDWAYSRSAQILVHEGRLTIFPVVAATAVFPVLWNALFGFIFEPTLGIFRLATVVITALGGIALCALCGDLGVSRGRSALGVAAHLANPLTFVLAFTVMTDAHFVTMLLFASCLFARAIEPEAVDGRWLVAGSLISGLAFLSRQQGALIVPAVVLFLLLAGRLRLNVASVRLLLQLVVPVAAVIAGYYLWLRSTGVPPQVQSAFLREALAEGWSGTWWLLRHLTFVELIYLGFFTLPIMATVVPATRTLFQEQTGAGLLAAWLWSIIAIVGVALFWQQGAFMPYISQFFGSGGLGPPDVLGSRPKLLTPDTRRALTVVCLVATLLLGLCAGRAVNRALGSRKEPVVSRADSVAGLVFCILLGQIAGVLPPSYHYIGWTAGSLDRYLLPLAPMAIALALWSVRDITIVSLLGWVVVAGMLAFSVAGTRDYLTYLQAVWQMADVAVARGTPLDRLDAGAGWDGYHLYEEGAAEGVRSRTPKGGPWWVYFYGPATDSAYIVSSTPRQGYRAVARREYQSWLQRKPTMLFLLRRLTVPWPPVPDGDSPYGRRTADGHVPESSLVPAATPSPVTPTATP
jgi:4-amino-4-deoxy-L-arabinose transferase-like glycosyltransferase